MPVKRRGYHGEIAWERLPLQGKSHGDQSFCPTLFPMVALIGFYVSFFSCRTSSSSRRRRSSRSRSPKDDRDNKDKELEKDRSGKDRERDRDRDRDRGIIFHHCFFLGCPFSKLRLLNQVSFSLPLPTKI